VPPFGETLKALAVLAALDDLQDTLELVFDPLHELSGVPAVSPNEGEAREPALDGRQDELGAITVLDMGAMNHNQQQEAKCIDQDVTFAPVDLFPGIIPAFPALFGCLDRLGVNYCRRWCPFASLSLAHLLA
jgi:hypothetical protein